jgi:hypothetical protein
LWVREAVKEWGWTYLPAAAAVLLASLVARHQHQQQQCSWPEFMTLSAMTLCHSFKARFFARISKQGSERCAPEERVEEEEAPAAGPPH